MVETSNPPDNMEEMTIDDLRFYYEKQLKQIEYEQESKLRFSLVEFTSQSRGRGKKRKERVITFVKDGKKTYYSLNKDGLKPVKRYKKIVIVDDLLNDTGAYNIDDALDLLRQESRQ